MEEYDWKGKKVSRKEDREAGCFVSPEGDWYNVDFGDHWEFTKAVLKERYGRSYGTPVEEVRLILDGKAREIEKELYELGWVWVHCDPMSGVLVRGRMNERQHAVLKEYFKDTRLFRGWTIDALYYGRDR
jgi:hypothetical protein